MWFSIGVNLLVRYELWFEYGNVTNFIEWSGDSIKEAKKFIKYLQKRNEHEFIKKLTLVKLEQTTKIQVITDIITDLDSIK